VVSRLLFEKDGTDEKAGPLSLRKEKEIALSHLSQKKKKRDLLAGRERDCSVSPGKKKKCSRSAAYQPPRKNRLLALKEATTSR